MNGLSICAGDVGNAYLNAVTDHKVYIVAGPEFGKYEGKRLIVHKALYGLPTSGARYHEHLSAKLRKMGYKPSRADPDLWMTKTKEGHYEYIARYVDDVISFSKNPMAVMKQLQEIYVMKGVGKPQYYLGGDVDELGEEWAREGITTAFSARTYIQNCLPKLAKMIGKEQFPKFSTPHDENYHPELDLSPLLSPTDISKYRSLIGSANWIMTLGRFDIAYTLQALSRYNMAPREGHLKALQRLFGYLRHHPDARIYIDNNECPIRREAKFQTNVPWEEFYPDAAETLPDHQPIPHGKQATITCFVDADHARDKVTRRSVSSIVLLINNTPIVFKSSRQKTVETSTYGSEMVAARIAVDMIIEMRYKLRMLGVPIEDQSVLVGDNLSVILSTTIPSSNLKKKHQACNYHRIREAIAGRFIRFGHIDSNRNLADVGTKPLCKSLFHGLLKNYLFRIPKFTQNVKATIKLIDKSNNDTYGTDMKGSNKPNVQASYVNTFNG
jgi:hypothetical protein